MNNIFSSQDGLCLAVSDEQNQDKLMVFKYHKEAGKLEVSVMDGETILSRMQLAPEEVNKVIADYLDSVAAYDKHAHPEHVKLEDSDTKPEIAN